MSTPLWTAADVATALGCPAPSRDWTSSGVSIDSRTLEPGDLFVALAGPNRDAHGFVADALRGHAAAAIVSRRPENVAADAPLLVVPDTQAALERLGQAARERSEARRIAVTGSVGKTGTKEMLRLVLGAQAPTHASVGSYNNLWGVPLTLARMPRETIYGVFELGMNHAGELAPLSRQVKPQVAIVTTIEAVHLEFFASVADIADAKAEIFAGMGPGGVAVLNRDNAHFARLAKKAEAAGLARIVGFGSDAAAEARLIDCSLHATCSAVTAAIGGTRLDYCLAVPGRHWVMNSLSVLAAVQAVGADVGDAAASLARMMPPKGRGQRFRVALPEGGFDLIDESYNASPVAVRAALAVLGRATIKQGGRRIAILGDMRELGVQAPLLHAGLAADIEENKIDLVYCCGPMMAHLHEALPATRRGAHAADSAALAPLVRRAIRPGDVVLVKGSLGSRMAPVVETLRALDTGDDALPRVVNGS
ncbi:MAG: UDP-N-acetylmuramoylalanyl-D-glutamyl-2,6-diaminopimelate--D-alanyl-D-alanine ligase [Rhodospirillaceae bacterium]|nr:UDP-N-acetylmuramoylalanyl-D-glutamyl-2,6-diaminopimelate--D-alanyl-D-alanine ligase [Rhodospirillaceae bacterium]